MKNDNLPFVSVVVCTFNGTKRIGECLKSLNAQTYPEDNFKIIVVDDGSTDSTAKVAQTYGSHVIRHEINRGIAAARNTGLEAATGDIVVYIDDDCIADSRWLEHLVEPFNNAPEIKAVGGKIAPFKTELLSERYLHATDYGNPARLEYGQSKHPVKRFWIYLRQMFNPIAAATEPVEVHAVFTANAAYRLSALRAIGGFDEGLLAGEDSDVSSRLRASNGRIMYMPDAIVYHRHHEQISKFISQTYFRAESTLHYYAKEKKFPPLFPLPVLYLVVVIGLAIVNPLVSLVFIIAGPFILYFWWVVRAVREDSFEYVIYGYIQFAVETATIFGLIRGWILRALSNKRPSFNKSSGVVTESPSGVSVSQIGLISILWSILMTVVVMLPNVSPWIATPIVLIGAILIPGLLLAINLQITPGKLAEYFLYSIGLGVAFLIIGGLGVNFILPYLGVAHPLAKLPLVIALDTSVVLLAVYGAIFNRYSSLSWKLGRPNISSLVFGIIPFLFLIASVLGAQRLNNSGTGTLTILMLFGIALYVIALAFWNRSIQGWAYILSLYLISLSLLLMYSLRSSHILGWDINGEYQVFQTTLQHLVWKMSYYPELDYNACLSITILPTIFQELTNIPSEYIFKFLFQVLFALTPVTLFVFARRHLNDIFAFLAAFLLASQTWFYEQMPALIRQETAFIFFALMLLVLFDKQLTKWSRYASFYIFTVALILSHYSTAYTWLTLVFGVLILSYGTRLFVRPLRDQVMIFTPVMFVLSLFLLFVWEVPITHTASAAISFVTNSGSEITNSLTPSVLKNELMESFFVGNNPNTATNIYLAEQGAIDKYGAQAGYDTYTDVTAAQYTPEAINITTPIPSKLPAFLSEVIALLIQASKLFLIDIFPIIGIVVVYLNLVRRQPSVEYDFILLNIVAYGLIVLMIFIPYLQQYYNFTRLYLQMFLVLSTVAIMGGLVVTKYVPRLQLWILVVMVGLIFCSLSGATNELIGGVAQVTLNQMPNNIDSFYIYDSEIASARWLAANRDAAEPVQADVMASLRLQSFANIDSSNTAIFPLTIEQNSYVYLIGVNIAEERAYYQYLGNTLVYSYPLAFLGSHKNLIYNDGGSRIYR